MIDRQNNDDDKNVSFFERIVFLGNKTMKIILAIDLWICVIIYVLKIQPWLNSLYTKHIVPDEYLIWVLAISIVVMSVIPMYIIGVIGKIIYHKFIKIKCPECGEINRGDIEYCVKCNYQIQDFHDINLFSKRKNESFEKTDISQESFLSFKNIFVISLPLLLFTLSLYFLNIYFSFFLVLPVILIFLFFYFFKINRKKSNKMN